MPIVQLQTVALAGNSGAPRQHTPKIRVFTEDEENKLKREPIRALAKRIARGNDIIALLENPAMLNMTPAQAAAISSNLRFQQDRIREIIKEKRGISHG